MLFEIFVENQGQIGSCTAQAGVGIVEYYEKRAFDKHLEASRLFLYKTTRNLMQVTGDAGGWLRSTMGALVLCGVPAEKYWPYNVRNFDVEPDAFVYSIANNYQALKYFCHDPQGAKIPYPEVLSSVKKYLKRVSHQCLGSGDFLHSINQIQKEEYLIRVMANQHNGGMQLWQ